MNKTRHKDRQVFILRWKPAISSFSLDDYRKCIRDLPDWWEGNWSVYEYEKAHKGDKFYMVRVGEGNTGVVFRGEFESDPYEGDDWAGTDKKRHYMDMICFDSVDPDEPANITAEELQKAIPEVDWMHGHSGVLLTDDQARRLNKLWEEKFGPDEEAEADDAAHEAFDPDQGHGAHLQCIDEDIDTIVSEALELVPKSKVVVGANKLDLTDDEGLYEKRTVFMLSSDEGRPVTLRSLVVAKEDRNELISTVPYANAADNQACMYVLKRIHEYSNGAEAVLTCANLDDGEEVSFYDVEYALHKDKYRPRYVYPFVITALAYNCKVVPEAERTIELDAETAARMHEAAQRTMPHEADDHPMPMSISTAEMVMCMPIDKRYPDDAEFCSPIVSAVRRVKFMGRSFYRMEVILHRDSADFDDDLPLTLVARTDLFDRAPRKGDPIRAHIWLQGRLKTEDRPDEQEE